MLPQRPRNKANLSRRIFLNLAVTLAIVVPASVGLGSANLLRAQAPGANASQDIADTWQGTLHAGRDLRIVAKISKDDGGGYKAAFYSIDQGGDPIPVTKITLDGSTVKMTITAIGGSYEGKLSADGKTIAGNWTQGPNPLPLVLTRATPETEWSIPAPTPKLPPMAANADFRRTASNGQKIWSANF